ncbi:unnamed protein product, partial [Heterotrigona itama]
MAHVAGATKWNNFYRVVRISLSFRNYGSKFEFYIVRGPPTA